jgi:DNA-binding PadR family transcriptional regulator
MEISLMLGQEAISGQLKKILAKLLKDGLVEWFEAESKSSKQRYQITQKWKFFLELVQNLRNKNNQT